MSTMFGCLIRLTASASRRKRATMRGDEASSRRSTFTAARRPSNRWRASYTVPPPPVEAPAPGSCRSRPRTDRLASAARNPLTRDRPDGRHHPLTLGSCVDKVEGADRICAVIDSHCHLDGDRFGNDLPAVMDLARAQRETDVYATVGVHPHDVSKMTEADWTELESLAGEARVVGIGETGLDYYYDHSPRPAQDPAYRRFVALARRAGSRRGTGC